jgi:hypothetical protein
MPINLFPESIRKAWMTPVYCGGNPPARLRLVWNYRNARTHGTTAVQALKQARQAVEQNKFLYVHGGGIGKPFKVGSDSVRWVDDTAAHGLREVGTADSVARHAVRHTGWYLSEGNDTGETAFGVVFQLSARDHTCRYVAGYRTSNDSDGSAAVCFHDITDDSTTAATWADRLAEIIAEQARDYNSAWQAGTRYAELGNEISETRREILDLCREIKSMGKSFPTAICKTLRGRISDNLRQIDKFRRKRAELEYNYGSADGFAEGAEI